MNKTKKDPVSVKLVVQWGFHCRQIMKNKENTSDGDMYISDGKMC